MVERIEACFPGLRISPFRVTSPAARDYNGIAWAAGNTAHGRRRRFFDLSTAMPKAGDVIYSTPDLFSPPESLGLPEASSFNQHDLGVFG